MNPLPKAQQRAGGSMSEQPTMRALEIYAKQLLRDAERKIAADPYAQPYMPPTGPESLRKLVQRCVKVRLLDPDALGVKAREIIDSGPELAIAELRKRAAIAEGEQRRQALIASTSLTRLAGLHARESRKQKDSRSGLNPGHRIDQALAGLAAVSQVPAAALGGDQVRGGERDRSPKFSGDQFGSSRAKAVRLAEELEALLDECRCRDLQRAA